LAQSQFPKNGALFLGIFGGSLNYVKIPAHGLANAPTHGIQEHRSNVPKWVFMAIWIVLLEAKAVGNLIFKKSGFFNMNFNRDFQQGQCCDMYMEWTVLPITYLSGMIEVVL